MKIILAVLIIFNFVFAGNTQLENMTPNTWMSIPNTKIQPLCPSESQYPGIRGTGGCKCVITAWSGGVYISGHKTMIVWGGGHNDYYGNEVYGFDINTLTWSVLRAPSTPTSPSMCPHNLPGYAPNSRHTYDGLSYIAHADRMFAFGGSLACYEGRGSDWTWTFNVADATWKYERPTGPLPRSCCSGSSAYDPLTGKVFYHDSYALFSYDYDSNTWTQYTSPYHGSDKGSAVDTKRNQLITVGSGQVTVTDLSASQFSPKIQSTSGGSGIVGAQGPGVEYDPVADKVLAWAGGSVYSLDTDTWQWAARSGSGAPSSQALRGTYGRFRYIPGENVFILVNGIDQNVYFYKNTAGSGPQGIDRQKAGTDWQAKWPEISIRPNPFHSAATITINCKKDITVLQIFNVQGKLLECFENQSTIHWKAEKLPNSLYILKFRVGTQVFSKKIMFLPEFCT